MCHEMTGFSLGFLEGLCFCALSQFSSFLLLYDLSEWLNLRFFHPFSSSLLLIFVSKSLLFHGKRKIKKSKFLVHAVQWRW